MGGVDVMEKLRTVLALLEQAEIAFKESGAKGFEYQAFMHYANKAWLAVYDLMKDQLV
jgi:hypothetical protein